MIPQPIPQYPPQQRQQMPPQYPGPQPAQHMGQQPMPWHPMMQPGHGNMHAAVMPPQHPGMGYPQPNQPHMGNAYLAVMPSQGHQFSYDSNGGRSEVPIPGQPQNGQMPGIAMPPNQGAYQQMALQALMRAKQNASQGMPHPSQLASPAPYPQLQ